MLIGIDASRAFLRRRTGIEEYSYQVIKHLREALPNDAAVRLYLRSDQTVDFDLPVNWSVRKLWAPRLWTQGRLAIEMLLHPPEILFVPAHTVPFLHPRKTVVTVHGLEYEVCPIGYGLFERLYMRFSIRNSVRWASTVVAVSENTKRDLVKLYKVPEEKIRVIYEGIGNVHQESSPAHTSKFIAPERPFFLFVGRLEVRKNVVRIVQAFERFKAKTNLPHRLVLVGKPGFGYEAIKNQIARSQYQGEIIETGYVSEAEKTELLKRAKVFVFPTLYEGFGLPVLEAQAARVPVITSTTSSLPEVAGEGALFVDPESPDAIAEAMEKLVADEVLRAGIIEKATRNANRFSWARCARELAVVISWPTAPESTARERGVAVSP